MITLKTSMAAALLALASAGFAQAPGDGNAAGAGQGARDGSRPADGAIVGGSISPAETGGLPADVGVPKTATERAIERCNELIGTLRHQCLEQEQSASGGMSRAPEVESAVRQAEPRVTPPPQNPR
jgi:hypothetical protein